MRAVLAFLLIVLLVFPLTLAALSLLSISSWALDPAFYSNALKDPTVYDALLSDAALAKFTAEMFGSNTALDAPTLRQVAKVFINADFMQTQIDDAVKQVFAYLNGKSASLDLKIDLKPMKTLFSGGQQTESLTALAAALPVCKEGQITPPENLGFYVCRPDFLKVDDFLVHYLMPSIEGFMKGLPDEIGITPPGLTSAETEQWRVWIPGGSLQNALMIAVVLLGIAALGFWLLAGLIASSAWSARLRWMGFALLIPALLVFLIGLASMQSGLVMPYVNLGLSRSGIESQLPFARDAAMAITRSALPRVSSGFMMVGSIASASALALIFWGSSLRPKVKKETVVVEVEKKE